MSAVACEQSSLISSQTSQQTIQQATQHGYNSVSYTNYGDEKTTAEIRDIKSDEEMHDNRRNGIT